jgi:ABC-2 type transport system ATP-binding protein
MTVLELEHVSKTYAGGFLRPRRPVLEGLSLRIESGEVFGLLGHNGAGKTTTMRVILGLLRPDAGRVRIFEREGTGREALSRIGFLGEEAGFYPFLNADETLQMTGELFGLGAETIRARKTRLLEAVGLRAKASARVKTYSKGMRQRLGIAVALMNDPEFLVLDEPYSGLDPIGRRQLRELLLDLKEKGKTILMSTHIVPDVEAVCDRVGILSGGSIQRCLALGEIYRQKQTPVEVTAVGVDPRLFERLGAGVEVVYGNPEAVVLRCEGRGIVKQIISKVYAFGGEILEVKPLKFNLEDYLLATLTEASKRGADTLATGIEELIHADTH